MHTKKRTSAAVSMEPNFQSSEWIYDALMAEIEPDLTSENIGKIDEKYVGETADEKAARYERYEFAFLTLNECIEDVKADLALDALILGGTVDAIAAEEENGKEIPMSDIDSYLTSFRFAA